MFFHVIANAGHLTHAAAHAAAQHVIHAYQHRHHAHR